MKKCPKYSLLTEEIMQELWESCCVGKISNYEFRCVTMDIIQKHIDIIERRLTQGELNI